MTAKKDTVSIYKNDNLLYIAQKNKVNLFLLKYKNNTNNIEKTVPGHLIASTVTSKDKLTYLHNLFGHQGIENFEITLQYYGYQFTTGELSNFICKTCELNNIKHAIIKLKNAVGFSGNDGEFFVMDSIEVLTTSRAGNVGFVLVTDINSRYRFIYCYRKKSDIVHEVINFYKWFQLKTGIRIKRLHSDQGTELYNQHSINFCNELGIEFTVSAPGVPEHNGIAERSNQFILQKIRKFINNTDLNVSLYWDFAAYYAVFITNRVTEGKRSISAYEKIFKEKPVLKKLFIFGAKVVVLKNNGNKVEQRGEFGLFMGYNHKTGEGLILTENKRGLIKSCNLKLTNFTENELQAQNNIYDHLQPQNMENPSRNRNLENFNGENSIENSGTQNSNGENSNTQNLNSENTVENSVTQYTDNEESISNSDKENELTETSDNNLQEKQQQLYPEEQFLRRSTRVTKNPQRLTYTEIASGNSMFLFENVSFLFEHSNLIEFAAAAVTRDNSIPKNYFQIESKPSCERWYKAYEKELSKLINVGKMMFVPKSEGSKEKNYTNYGII
eukprot:snap_masked-scaffold_26-processed-gene-4.133-mRNA-1 protein AED:1.00 eAED:1.00 QI:0/-1/0/0/-1/1/1/0/556